MGERVFSNRWGEEARLGDGTRVRLRLLRPDDAKLLAEGYARLSPESRYRRFLGARGELGADELRYLTEVDGERHFALAALRPEESEGLGVARFVRLRDEPNVAEPAVTVIDHMQGKGLGKLLLLRLAAAARERSIESFRCHVLASNEPMRQILRALGPDAKQKSEGEVVQVDLPLAHIEGDAPQMQREHPLYRLLIEAAAGALFLVTTTEVLGHWLAEHAPPRRNGPN